MEIQTQESHCSVVVVVLVCLVACSSCWRSTLLASTVRVGPLVHSSVLVCMASNVRRKANCCRGTQMARFVSRLGDVSE
jgi:hypothetical protein